MLLLPSRFAVLCFKLTALGWILLLLLTPAALAASCYTIFMMEREPAGVAIKLIGLAALVFLMHWLFSLRARCPRCLTGLFTRKNCSRHGSAKRLLGSHRLRVATSVVFRQHFQCPWCGEFTAMRARNAQSSRKRR